MAATALQELVVSLGLDASDFQQGVQQVAHEIADGIGGSLEEVTPLVESMLEGFAEGFTEAAQEAGVLGTEGAEAVEEVGEAAKDAAQVIRKDLPQAAKQATAQMETTFNGVASKFRNFAMQIVGPIAGAFAISGAVSTFMSGAMAAKEQAQEIGVATDELQLWQGAITRAGGNVNKFEMSLRRMAMSGKVAGDPLKALYNLAGDAEKMDRDAFTAKAKALGIDVATIGVLMQGRKALDEHLKRAKEIGIYEQRHIEMAEKLKIGLWELNGSFDGLKNELLIMVLPAMQKILSVLTDVTLFMSDNAPFVAALIGTIGAALAIKLLPRLKQLPWVIKAIHGPTGQLLPPLKQIQNVVKAIFSSFGKWTLIIGIIAAIAAIAEDFWIYLTDGESELEEFWSIFGTGPEILAAVSKAWQDFKKWATECLVGAMRLIKQLWQTLSKWGVIEDIKNAFMGLGHIIHGVLTGNWKEVGEGAKSMLLGILKVGWDVAKGIGKAFYDWISGAFAQLKEWVKNWFQNLLSEIPGLSAVINGVQTFTTAGGKGSEDAKTQKFTDALSQYEDEVEDVGATAQKTADEAESALTGAASAAGAGMANAAAQAQSAWGAALANIGAGIQDMMANMQAMGAGGMVPAFAGVRAANAGGGVSNNNNSVNIGTMNVSTRATDANGVARGMGGALNRNRLVQAKQSGVRPK